jgi:hypothetical protein
MRMNTFWTATPAACMDSLVFYRLDFYRLPGLRTIL